MVNWKRTGNEQQNEKGSASELVGTTCSASCTAGTTHMGLTSAIFCPAYHSALPDTLGYPACQSAWNPVESDVVSVPAQSRQIATASADSADALLGRDA